MLITIVMLFHLILGVTPTLQERHDLINDCETIASHRAITVENANEHMIEGVVIVDEPSAVGLVDHHSVSYPPCNEFGEQFFSAGWLVSASVSSKQGLSVIENGQVVFVQDVSYSDPTATISVENAGRKVRYYLDGEFVFETEHKTIGGRDLRGYYFGQVSEHLID